MGLHRRWPPAFPPHPQICIFQLNAWVSTAGGLRRFCFSLFLCCCLIKSMSFHRRWPPAAFLPPNLIFCLIRSMGFHPRWPPAFLFSPTFTLFEFKALRSASGLSTFTVYRKGCTGAQSTYNFTRRFEHWHSPFTERVARPFGKSSISLERGATLEYRATFSSSTFLGMSHMESYVLEAFLESTCPEVVPKHMVSYKTSLNKSKTHCTGAPQSRFC